MSTDEGTITKDKLGQERCIHKVQWHGETHYVDCKSSLDNAFWYSFDKEPEKSEQQ